VQDDGLVLPLLLLLVAVVVIIRRAAACAAAEAVGGGPDASIVEPDGAVAHGLHLTIIISAAQVDVAKHDAGAGHGVAAGEPDGLGGSARRDVPLMLRYDTSDTATAEVWLAQGR
jgi:hypothetical protein